MKKLFEILSFVLVAFVATSVSAQDVQSSPTRPANIHDVAMPSSTVIKSFPECVADLVKLLGPDARIPNDFVKTCKELAKEESKRSREIEKEESKSHRPQVVYGGGGGYGYTSYPSYGYNNGANTYRFNTGNRSAGPIAPISQGTPSTYHFNSSTSTTSAPPSGGAPGVK